MTARNTICPKEPWRKSVTMTATWPPTKTNSRAVPRSTAMSSGNVPTSTNPRLIEGGRPSSAMKNLAATAGKMP
ncbi:MAG: hypothetical protein CMJ34_04875 [Phycisphaerae bacterium]|nr:hypothetical protein [Phycisphaerae bacterium]